MRAYQKGDANAVAVQEAQVHEAEVYGDELEKIFAYTLCDENKVYGVFGWQFGEEPNTAECYALVSQFIGTKLLETVRFFNREIPLKMKTYGVEFLYMTVKKNFYAGKRLAKLLGFSFKGNLVHFFEDEDYQLFERREI